MAETRQATPYLSQDLESPGPVQEPVDRDSIRAVLDAYRAAHPPKSFEAAARAYGERHPQATEDEVRRAVAEIICSQL